MKNLFDIKGNVTVITGGTGVLGRAIAKYLAHQGASVIILGRKEDVGREIVEAVMAEKPAGSIEFMKTDVMDQAMLGQKAGASSGMRANIYKVQT